jgi:phenylalanyl-tRNA synthetase beta chain
MKIAYRWLKDWVAVSWSAKELGARLTMAGFELEALANADVEDATLELNVTPNRGDAMSVLGIAREVAALAGRPLTGPQIDPVKAQLEDALAVRLDAPAACPKFVGRIIRGVNNRAVTPVWMRQRLESVGARSISPLVDVTNYVLLELGQPMHAYDLSKLQSAITVRTSTREKIVLLDGRMVEVGQGTLLITDEAGPVGIAGIMGGERTAVSETTTDVFLEVAYFSPDAMLGRARKLGLQTDASQRFERGVDPALQERAMERATALILAIAGGSAGPTQVTQSAQHLPARAAVTLRGSQLKRLLGTAIPDERIVQVLESLGMKVAARSKGVWDITPPAHRFDIAIEADLIEEVARIVGYEAIPEADASGAQQFRELPAEKAAERSVLELLVARGYHEAITLAFVDPALQSKLFPDLQGAALANPISSDLAVMRVSLWPGLLQAALENQRRQQDRIRLFEHGTRFLSKEIDTLAGIACGLRLPEQWAVSKETRVAIDFFDIKADLQALFMGTGAADELNFETATQTCLHPGRSARITRAGQTVGWLGELHPTLVRELGFTYAPVLFELDYVEALRVKRPSYQEFSRFPQVRRDLALVLDEAVSFSALRERVISVAPAFLHDFLVFDVYRGPGVETGRKSVALGLIFQDISRTLTDAEIDGAVAAITAQLRVSLNAKIRE